VIIVVRNILEPRSSAADGVHPLAMLASMYVGLKSSLIGIFVPRSSAAV
jgi:hypothetical protein